MNTLLLLIIGIPLIEIYLFIKIGSQIGAFNTVLLILVTAVIGVAYVRYEGFNTIKSGIGQLVKNELPVYEIISGAAIAFAMYLGDKYILQDTSILYTRNLINFDKKN